MQLQSVVSSSRAGTPLCLPARSRVASLRRAVPLVCSARKDDGPSVMPKLAAAPMAAALAAALLLGSATMPLDAEAARSGGRVGGSVRSAPRAAAPKAAPSSSTTYNSTTIVAPPLVGGYGGFGYGMGGGFMPSFFFPGLFFGGGGFFQFIFLMFAVSTIFSVVTSIANKNKDDDYR